VAAIEGGDTTGGKSMKKIGIIGGLGPEATIEYYRRMIATYREKSGSDDYPQVIINSINLEQCMRLAEARDWNTMAGWLLDAVKALHRAGADFAVIAAGTPHIVFDEVTAASPIPLLSIVEETLAVVQGLKLKCVGLVGTLFTMQSTLYQEKFSGHDVRVVVPGIDDQKYVHNKLRTEIALGRLVDRTRQDLLAIVARLKESQSIQGLILGCTELPLILTKDYLDIPFLDTTGIHVDGAVDYCLKSR
jgi:aspartate racemase